MTPEQEVEAVFGPLRTEIKQMEKELAFAGSMIETLAKRNRELIRENAQLSAEVERRVHVGHGAWVRRAS